MNEWTLIHCCCVQFEQVFNHIFNKQKYVACVQMLCLDYSNLQEKRNVSKLYMIVRGIGFLSMVLEMNVVFCMWVLTVLIMWY